MSKYFAGLGIALLLFAPSAFAEDAKEELWTAVKKGDAKAVEALLAKGVDVNAKTDYGATALHFAADKGNTEVVQVLLKHKANANAKDTFYSATPLLWAQMKNHWGVVKLLVESGADGAVSLLTPAVRAGQTEVVQAILAQGKAKADALDTALAAVPPKHPEIEELLKKAGAKPVPPKPEVKVAADTLKLYEGTYEGPGQQIKLVVKDSKLVIDADGQILALKAVDDSHFKLATNEAVTMSIERDGDKKVTGFGWKVAGNEIKFKRLEVASKTAPEKKPEKQVVVDDRKAVVTSPLNWPSFRGPNASGVADGQFPPLSWDVEQSTNIAWKTPIPGIAHSCPVIWDNNLFITTAVSGDPKASLRTGQYGDVDSVNDATVHTWRVYCLDKRSGKILWEQTASQGVPRVKRHLKGSHANPTPATDGTHVIACFGSEGLFCYDFQGKLLWKRDLGTLDSGWFYNSDYQWGFGSSPILYKNMVIVQCDFGKGSFLAAYDVKNGHPIWQTPREEIPSWGTPTVVETKDHAELVTNATKFIRGYDPMTGKELWRLGKNAEITAPTPIFGHGLIFVTSGYRPIQPIYAIRPGAKGDISLKEKEGPKPEDSKPKISKAKDSKPQEKDAKIKPEEEKTTSNEFLAWSKKSGGPYMPTPIIYGPYLYTLANNGLLTCYDAETGKQIFKERIPGKGGYTASPVAADGYLYLTSEEGEIRVVKAGTGHEIVSTNQMNDICMATPAISEGFLFVRTQHYVYGIARSRLASSKE